MLICIDAQVIHLRGKTLVDWDQISDRDTTHRPRLRVRSVAQGLEVVYAMARVSGGDGVGVDGPLTYA